MLVGTPSYVDRVSRQSRIMCPHHLFTHLEDAWSGTKALETVRSKETLCLEGWGNLSRNIYIIKRQER